MSRIEDLCLSVALSNSVADEQSAIEELWEYASNNEVSTEMFSIDGSGNKMDVNEISEVSAIKKVHVVFSRDNRTRVLEWTPLSIDNAFILFRVSGNE